MSVKRLRDRIKKLEEQLAPEYCDPLDEFKIAFSSALTGAVINAGAGALFKDQSEQAHSCEKLISKLRTFLTENDETDLMSSFEGELHEQCPLGDLWELSSALIRLKSEATPRIRGQFDIQPDFLGHYIIEAVKYSTGIPIEFVSALFCNLAFMGMITKENYVHYIRQFQITKVEAERKYDACQERVSQLSRG